MCSPRSGAMRLTAPRSRATIASPSRKKKNAISTDSVSCSSPSATPAPPFSASAFAGSTSFLSSTNVAALSCANVDQ